MTVIHRSIDDLNRNVERFFHFFHKSVSVYKLYVFKGVNKHPPTDTRTHTFQHQILMSDQEVTYSTLRFLQSPSESQSRLRCDSTQSPRKAVNKEFSVPWKFIAVTFGIFCLLLLTTVIVLVIKIFQYVQEKHHQQEIMQKDNYLKEQLLTNKSLENDGLKNKILQLESNHEYKCYKKIMIFSQILQNKGMLCEGNWSCYGVKCYYFTKSKKNWEGCKKTCQDNGLSLLKINDEEEQVFLKQQACKNNYWIGLSYDKWERKWKWIDSDPSSGISLSMLPSRGHCVFLSTTREVNIECTNIYNCICEKRIDSISSTLMCDEKKRN